uniref:BAP29/BAP31 transmembrane domain-containing protein n=1 Tax=Trieres chinensis TaxID=1514140 RepID=A0A6U1T5K6_TRICV|mmetsp:Transcript_12530/g.26035  ORF Transcript_12530/g.26035 Transcript_12530/m.26035 type:complete len:168 (+) Transcript_12530:210-713(+)
MGAWNQLIWIFFPIPIFCLALLSLTWPKTLQKFGADLVGKIFFTRFRAGPVSVQPLWLFFGLSLFIFVNVARSLHSGPAHCKTCQYHAETMWYTKAMKWREERNFWLSLFNVILWYMVWTVHRMRRKILELKDRVSELEEVVKAQDGSSLTDEKPMAPKDEVAKKED